MRTQYTAKQMWMVFMSVQDSSGHGFMHGPVFRVELMAEKILDGKFSSVDVSMLDLKRFEEGQINSRVQCSLNFRSKPLAYYRKNLLSRS